MTWKLTIRGDVSGYTRAEYRCPVHGVFEAVVARVGGNTPDRIPCPALMADDLDCGWVAPWTITNAPGLAFQRGAVRQGKVEEAPHPYVTDTRELGEGMPLDEWKAKRARQWNDLDYKEHKEGR